MHRSAARAICIALCLWHGRAAAEGALPPITPQPNLLERSRHVWLEVLVNDEPAGPPQPFLLDPARGGLFVARRVLASAGLRVSEGVPEEEIAVAAQGLAFELDDARLQIRFQVSDAQRAPRVFDAAIRKERPRPRSDPGLLVNYAFFGGALSDMRTGRFTFSGANATLEGRAFSDLGTFTQNAIIGMTPYNPSPTTLRLDTTYSYADVERAHEMRLGDTISGGLAWTRPLRLGGMQIRRDFTLRSDIVTRPIPVISGTAAAPSTVDVFLSGIGAYRQNVGTGPFQIANIPLLAGGAGDARVVVRDASGREVETSLRISAPISMLAPGLMDYSFEAGFARRNFGIRSADYDLRPVASATIRRGLTQWVTLDAHVEGGAGLIQGGLGATSALGPFGALTTAAASSHSARGAGALGYAGWQGTHRWLTLSLSSQRSFGRYDDLASVTASNDAFRDVSPVERFKAFTLGGDTRVPRKLDRASLSAYAPAANLSFSIGYINQVSDRGERAQVTTISVNKQLPWRITAFLSGFVNMSGTRNKGVYAGLSMPLGSDMFASLAATVGSGGSPGASSEIIRPQPLMEGDYGWRVRGAAGGDRFMLASGSYRSAIGQVGAQAAKYSDSVSAAATFDGAVALIGGGLTFGNRVNSSFVVVDAGLRDVPVLQDNRIVGRTGAFGRKLIGDLRPWEENRIGVDMTDLPIAYSLPTSHDTVTPAARAGVFLDFGKSASMRNALVVVVDATGKPLPVGTSGTLSPAGETITLGYDGQAYLRNLAASNSLTVDLGAGSCTTTFDGPAPGQDFMRRTLVCEAGDQGR
jgi:outer membrane usher protein